MSHSPETAAPLPPRPRTGAAQLLSRHRYARLPYKVANRVERRRLLRDNPAATAGDGVVLSRREGRLWVICVDPRASAEEARRSNLALATSVCERAGVPYLAVPEPGTSTVTLAVDDDRWEDFVEALRAEGADRPVYTAVEVAGEGGRVGWWSCLVTDAGPETLRARDTLPVFTIQAPTPEAPFFGRAEACRVERWRTDPDGTLRAPSWNGRTQVVDPEHRRPGVVRRDGRDLPTLAPLARTHVFDVDFDVDLVYLWVDGGDPEWLARKQRALEEVTGTRVPAGHGSERFRDNGELRFALRSAHQFAPWARRVYLVTDRQVPHWLDRDHPWVTLVDHEELFDGAGRLPTFNSHAIGSRLHHIDGLSEQYLYLNDDVFFGRPVSPRAFFHANGVSKFFLSKATLPLQRADTMPPHLSARNNVVRLLERDFGRTATRTFFHTPVPQRRSVLEELEETYPEVFARNWASQFRSSEDYEVNSWLHHYYGYLRGATAPDAIRYDYFDLSDPSVPARLDDLLRKRDRDCFCINDNADALPGAPELVADWLRRYFPDPAPFETDA